MKNGENPWDIYAPALVSAAVLYIFAFVLKFNAAHMIICVVGLVAIFFFFTLLWDIAYPKYFARKIEFYVDDYRQTHDADTFFEKMSHLKKFAFSQNCKNIILLNKWAVLYEENRLQECLDLLSEYELKAKKPAEKNFITNAKMLCYKKMHNTDKLNAMERELQNFSTGQNADTLTPANACRSKKAMVRWLLATVVFFLLLLAAVYFKLYDGFVVAFLFFDVINLLFTFIWMIKWLVLRAKAQRSC